MKNNIFRKLINKIQNYLKNSAYREDIHGGATFSRILVRNNW
jgi:hypothetical protein